MLSRDDVDRQEELLRNKLADLPDEKRKGYYKTVKGKIKDPDTYAVCNYLFVVGLHHFYLGNWRRGCIDLGIFLAGLIFFMFGEFIIGLVLMLIVLAIEFYALCRSQIIVQDFNNKIMQQILDEIDL